MTNASRHRQGPDALRARLRPATKGGLRWSIPRSKVLASDPMLVVRASLRGTIDLWRVVESR